MSDSDADPDADGDTAAESLPDGWIETEDRRDPDMNDKYDPRQPELFEREGGDEVQVHAAPVGENRPHGDGNVWQVGIVAGSVTAPAEIERTHEVEGRGTAMDLARDLMAAYEDRGDVESARNAIEENDGLTGGAGGGSGS